MQRRVDDLFSRYPWLAALVAGGFSAAIGVPVIRGEMHLDIQGPGDAALLVLGLVSVPAIVWVATKLGLRHLVYAALLVVVAALDAAAGFYYGLGWTRHGADVDPATLPGGAHAFGAGVVIFLALVSAAGAVVIILRSAAGEPSETAGSVEHAVAVYDVRPDPGDPKNQFDPYYVAICSCDWTGDVHATSDEAFADAYRHDPNVAETIERPVG